VCNIALKPYNGYEWIRSLSCRKYLVTIGYHRFQHSKIEALGIAADFDEIVIADPNVSNKSKKEVFSDILVRSKYSPKEVLVVGDDYDSEIKTARELGIDAVLFNASGNFTGETDVPVVSGYNELLPLL
jgi:putative hydrolase of the HAD superfamily